MTSRGQQRHLTPPPNSAGLCSVCKKKGELGRARLERKGRNRGSERYQDPLAVTLSGCKRWQTWAAHMSTVCVCVGGGPLCKMHVYVQVYAYVSMNGGLSLLSPWFFLGYMQVFSFLFSRCLCWSDNIAFTKVIAQVWDLLIKQTQTSDRARNKAWG